MKHMEKGNTGGKVPGAEHKQMPDIRNRGEGPIKTPLKHGHVYGPIPSDKKGYGAVKK
jgi:hypothetical protein